MPDTPPPPPEASTDNEAAPEATPGRVPSRGWYGLAFVLLLIGVAAFTASVNVARQRVDAKLQQMQRFVAPGESTLTLDAPGKYLVYYEKIGEHDGKTFDTSAKFPELPKFDLDVREEQTGEYLPVQRAIDDASQMYNHGRANSEFAFTAEQPGDYTVITTHENDFLDDRLLMAVGPPVVDDLMENWRGPFGGAAVLAFAFTVSALTVLLTWLLRHGKLTRRDT